jgi:Rab3 GTPase-activating protein catalytic subunit
MPLWGPLDDPVASIYATTTWHGKSNGNEDNDNENDGIVEPLMKFPLRIRSRQKLSQRDWIDLEESVERTILNPLEPSNFCIQAYYDRDTSVATLAANQRCILAALIRAATLPDETMLQHLTDESLVSRWDDKAGTIVANKVCDRNNVGEKTRQIVKVMDWSSIIEDMIETWQVDEILHQVMDGGLTLGFPSSPEQAFSESDVFSPFRKSAPYGRLLSVLFSHMAKLRALSSMALVWVAFVQELRRRWEARESLPNMQYVPGLDPHPLVLYEQRSFSTIGLKANFAAFLHCSEADPDDYHCLIGQKLQVFNLGVEGLVAGELAEHEAMERFLGAGEIPTSVPEKLSNGNLSNTRSSIDAAESMIISAEADEIKESLNGKRKWPKAKDKANVNVNANAAAVKGDQKNYGPPTINTDLEFWVMDEPGHANNLDHGLDFAHPATDDTGFDFVAPAPTNLDDLDMDMTTTSQSARKRKQDNKIVVEGLPDQAWEGTIMDGSDAGSVATSCSQSQAYYDAAEAGSIFSMKNGFVNLDTVVNVADMLRRPGARCPIHEVTYGPEHNQLYAPYLLRPYPLTDDVVRERRMMLERHPTDEKKRISLQYRIELAHRFQKPKLLSDMCAFKAANPDIGFEDFTKWYGNPGNPLDDYHDEEEEIKVETRYDESAAKKLDKASEAMKVLTSTRDFWSSTWDEAEPVPASEQKPLFDVGMSVEIALDYLEQMHPTNLLNQILAVNLSAAYFTLVSSADDALDIELVKTCVQKLRSKIDKALHKLARDAVPLSPFSTPTPDHGSQASVTSQKYAASDTITACEEACTALGEVETMIARATSLLNKFPNQLQLIQNLLLLADGTPVRLDDEKGRISFLNAIHHQQQQHSTFSTLESLPKPVLREYVLRNLDEDNPCQLSVRFGDEGAYLDRVDNEGGVLLALSKSYKD